MAITPGDDGPPEREGALRGGEPRPDVDADGRNIELGVPYQQAGQVRQALAELHNATGQGNLTRTAAAIKHLIGLGWLDGETPAAVDGSVDARRRPPEGRSATPPSTVRTDVPTTPTLPTRSGSPVVTPVDGSRKTPDTSTKDVPAKDTFGKDTPAKDVPSVKDTPAK